MITYPNAKLNIGLDVIRKRPDGFHDLESLFIPYKGLTDTLEITQASKFSIEIVKNGRVMDGTAPGEWDPRKDLCAKAYQLLKADYNIPAVKIRLQKNIPVGAGLGGGSADAAFTLLMLDEMFDLYMPYELLEDYAAQIGSDCPFFIYNRPMFVSGRGEVLEEYDLPALDDYDIRVVTPEGVSVSTKQAYAGIVPAAPQTPLRELLALPVSQWRSAGVKNDFEKTVFAVYPQLADLKDQLYGQGAVYASMSGSGSALFGLFARS